MDIYVGNLAREVTEEELRKEFMVFGKVTSVKIIKDRNSGQRRGFAFVSMPSKLEAQGAIITLNRKKLKKQPLEVSEAHPRLIPRKDKRG